MENPWLDISLKDYEEHMASADVFQLQCLNRIVKEQLRYRKPFVAVLGAAGGNGLEHILPAGVETVYALDINEKYLMACRERYAFLKQRLQTIRCDLSVADMALPFSNILICNLIVEYLGLDAFAELLKRNMHNLEIVSVVLQKDRGRSFVSESSSAVRLKALDALHSVIDETELGAKLAKAGFVKLLRKTYPLPNGKEFVRIDYKKR
jgi:hypothetical protein